MNWPLCIGITILLALCLAVFVLGCRMSEVPDERFLQLFPDSL